MRKKKRAAEKAADDFKEIMEDIQEDSQITDIRVMSAEEWELEYSFRVAIAAALLGKYGSDISPGKLRDLTEKYVDALT